MNELLIGTWWASKDEYGVHMYKGPNPPTKDFNKCGPDWEFNWINLEDYDDFCWKHGNRNVVLHSEEFTFINTNYLEEGLSKITIYPSGNYIIEDYDG